MLLLLLLLLNVRAAGVSQLWLSECLPELSTRASMRQRLRRAVWSFVLQHLQQPQQQQQQQPKEKQLLLPPLYAADLYVHCGAEGTDTCRCVVVL